MSIKSVAHINLRGNARQERWSPLYCMLKDRFGVTWVLNVAIAPTGQVDYN